MSGFVIKYNDIYELLWEYKEKLETCENSIRFFIESGTFQGEGANAIKNYLNDVHITMLSSFKVTAQNLLDNIVSYKAGYYEIDSSTNFVLPEETIKELRSKLNTGYGDTEDCAGEVHWAVSGISDISAVSQPDTNGVFQIHAQLDQELMQLISDIETHESNTVKALENSTDLLIGSLQACIGKIGTNWTDINHYESNSFYTDTDAYTLAGISQIFYQQHQDNEEVYNEIWGVEQGLRDAAEARETQGVWKTVGGAALVVTGALCIAATGGAATPIVVAGWGIGGGTIAFGVADSIEGAQDIYYGSMGDIDSTAINQLKDVIFQGNEDAYYFAENIFAFTASAFIPISKAATAGNLTFRSGTTIVAKEGLATLAGEGASNITMNLTDNQTASMLAGMLASGVTAQGLNGIDAKFNISGNRGGKYSVLGEMSEADGIKYNNWMKVREGELNIDYVNAGKQLADKLEADGYKIIKVEDASIANADWYDMGFDKPPIAEGTNAFTVEAGNYSYSRVYLEGYNNPMSSFIIRSDYIAGLSAEEIAQKLALSKVPNKIVNVELPPTTPLEVSIVGPQPDWGTIGGDIQFAIKDVDLNPEWFTNIQDLK